MDQQDDLVVVGNRPTGPSTSTVARAVTGPDAGMSHEPTGIGIGGRGGHLEMKLVDVAVQPVQQFETPY